MTSAVRDAIAALADRHDLSPGQAEAAMDEIMEGKATPAQVAAFLVALRMKGETVEEIAACARVMRRKATPVRTRHPVTADTCGTGGDGRGTANVSTLAALAVAAAGLPVAKHGNRSVSSRCGSADLLEALGLRLDISADALGNCLDACGFAFLFAPALHPAMKHAIGPRREIGLRTIFNLLGPLTNPAGASVQIVGVYRPELTEPIAGVLHRLGVPRAMVVHGADGLDELSTTGPNRVTTVEDGRPVTRTLSAADAGLPGARLEDLVGGDPAENVRIARDVLGGKPGPVRDVVLLNAGALLHLAGKAPDLRAAVRLAAQAVDSGAAGRLLEDVAKFTQANGPAAG